MFDQDEIGAEEIERHYSACMDSVHLINGGKPSGISADAWADVLARNKGHLQTMLAKPFWTDQHDMRNIRKAAA